MAVYGGHWLQARSHFETDTKVGDVPVPHPSMMMMVMMMMMIKVLIVKVIVAMMMGTTIMMTRTVVDDAPLPHPLMGLSALLCGKLHTPIHDDGDGDDDADGDHFGDDDDGEYKGLIDYHDSVASQQPWRQNPGSRQQWVHEE